MNPFILKNLRKRFADSKQELSEEGEAIEEVASIIPYHKHAIYNININKFEKPVGAVVLPGAGYNKDDINDVIKIKKVE